MYFWFGLPTSKETAYATGTLDFGTIHPEGQDANGTQPIGDSPCELVVIEVKKQHRSQSSQLRWDCPCESDFTEEEKPNQSQYQSVGLCCWSRCCWGCAGKSVGAIVGTDEVPT